MRLARCATKREEVLSGVCLVVIFFRSPSWLFLSNLMRVVDHQLRVLVIIFLRGLCYKVFSLYVRSKNEVAA